MSFKLPWDSSLKFHLKHYKKKKPTKWHRCSVMSLWWYWCQHCNGALHFWKEFIVFPFSWRCYRISLQLIILHLSPRWSCLYIIIANNALSCVCLLLPYDNTHMRNFFKQILNQGQRTWFSGTCYFFWNRLLPPSTHFSVLGQSIFCYGQTQSYKTVDK